jgi:hypothetical protein
LKNGKIIKRYLTRKQWLFYSVETKLFLISEDERRLFYLVATEGERRLFYLVATEGEK